MPDTPVGPGVRVTVSFSLSLATGELIDTTGEKTAAFNVGDGTLPPGFESAMFGMKAGDSAVLEIAADRGFGQPDPDNVQRLQRTEFVSGPEPAAGLVVAFADSGGRERPGVITRLCGETVEVDFNHPLAGRDLLFSVTVHAVERVSDEIIRV